jgi:hypothetical protein
MTTQNGTAKRHRTDYRYVNMSSRVMPRLKALHSEHGATRALIVEAAVQVFEALPFEDRAQAIRTASLKARAPEAAE